MFAHVIGLSAFASLFFSTLLFCDRIDYTFSLIHATARLDRVTWVGGHEVRAQRVLSRQLSPAHTVTHSNGSISIDSRVSPQERLSLTRQRW